MQDKHPIDNFFKENTEQHFPYDSALWSTASKGLTALFVKKGFIILSSLSLVTISVIALILALEPIDNIKATVAATKSETMTESGINGLSKEEPFIEKKGTTSHDDDDNLSNPTKNLYTETVITPEEVVEITQVVETNEILNNTPPETKSGEGLILANEIKEYKEPLLSETEVESGVAPEQEVNTGFSEILINTKPTISFKFDLSNNKPQLMPGYPEKRLRKFALSIELENLMSSQLKHTLGRLPNQELEYRKRFERVQNMASYSLNVMFQRRGFGLITGIGYSRASIKTAYESNSYSYDYTTRYRIEQESVKYVKDSVNRKNGYYSQIREYNDTTSRNSETTVITGQSAQNNFEWLHVPLKLSYQYSHNRLRFSLRTGADLMWLYDFRGSFINSNLDGLTDIGEKEQSPKRFNINISAQIMAGYQMHRKLQVGGSFYINGQTGSNFTKYDSRFQSKGFGWYLRYSL